jgi:hypothetical protein
MLSLVKHARSCCWLLSLYLHTLCDSRCWMLDGSITRYQIAPDLCLHFSRVDGCHTVSDLSEQGQVFHGWLLLPSKTLHVAESGFVGIRPFMFCQVQGSMPSSFCTSGACTVCTGVICLGLAVRAFVR